MNFDENNYLKLTKDEIENCRHKSEKRWYRILVIINFLIIIGVIVLCIINIKNYTDVATNFTNSVYNIPSSPDVLLSPQTLLNDVPTELQLMLAGIVMLIGFPFAINAYYAKYRSKAIRITEKNFPEIYYKIEEYSHKLGLNKVPEGYIVQENGILNAFSAFLVRKQYIEVHADLLEIAYREFNDLDSINFIVAHELAHIKLKHATFKYNLWILFSNFIPVLSTTASRAREYSCDRLAQKVSGNNGIQAMFSLSAGKHLYKQIDVEDYIKHSYDVHGFFVWCNNLVSTHPILTKRIRALAKGEGSGELY